MEMEDETESSGLAVQMVNLLEGREKEMVQPYVPAITSREGSFVK